MRERIGRVQARTFVSGDKDGLIGEANLCMKAKQNQEFIHYIPQAGKGLAISWKQGFIMLVGEVTWRQMVT